MVKFIETESRTAIARGRGGESAFHGCSVPGREDGKVLETDALPCGCA